MVIDMNLDFFCTRFLKRVGFISDYKLTPFLKFYTSNTFHFIVCVQTGSLHQQGHCLSTMNQLILLIVGLLLVLIGDYTGL